MRRSAGRIPCQRVAHAVGLSLRHLRRQVHDSAGLSPKTYARVLRLAHTMQMADGSAAPVCGDIAARGGYCDQSHLIREALALGGASPAQLHAERRLQRVAAENPIPSQPARRDTRAMITSLLLTLAFGLGQAPAAPTPFDAARWTLLDPDATAMPYLGRPSLFLDDGLALLRGSSFADGTIEFDLAMHGHASFAGVAFRAASGTDYELVYLRPHRSRQPDALQYTPIFGGAEAWQLYSGEGYTAAAELPVNRWVHVRLVVAGQTARLFVDGAAEPQLVVTDLKRPWARGQVGLWGRLGGAHFTNVVVTEAPSTAPAALPNPPPTPGLVLDWSCLPPGRRTSVRPDVLPSGPIAWTAARAEPSGILNISRFRNSVRSTATAAQRSRTWSSCATC